VRQKDLRTRVDLTASMADDELYDDLDTDKKLLPCDASPNAKGLISPESKVDDAVCAAISGGSRMDASCGRPKSLVDELKELEERVGFLEKEKQTLKRNMGALYRTAVAELQRKDDQIQELQRELSNHQVRVDETMKSSPG
jgi:vacuolar-type H+-ATPase subunit I/STV1